MSRPVSGPRGKAGGLHTSMCMSQASYAKVQSKMDKEKARHEQEVKMLEKIEKAELRQAQRELEEVKRELHTLKAYKLVAQQTAFKKFDRLELKKRERREKQRQAREEAIQKDECEREMASPATGGDGDENTNVAANSQGRRRSSTSGDVFVTLRDILENDDVLRRHSQEIVQRRRKSLAVEGDEDDGNEKEGESSKRSRVRTWLNSTPKRKSSNDNKNNDDRQEKARSKGLRASFQENAGVDGQADAVDTENVQNEAEQSSGSDRPFRRSQIGTLGNLVENVIQEDLEAERQEKEDDDERMEDDKENVHYGDGDTREVKSLVVSGRKGFKMDRFSNGFFITASHDDPEPETCVKTRKAANEKPRRTSSEQLRPMTLFEISKMYEAKKAQKLEENENKLMNLQRRKAQKEYEQFRIKLQQKEHERQKALTEKQYRFIPNSLTDINHDKTHSSIPLNATGQQSSINKDDAVHLLSPSNQTESKENTPLTAKSMPTPSSAPLSSFWSTSSKATTTQKEAALGDKPTTTLSAPLKGLDRFRNAAAAVAVNQRVSQSQGANGSDRMKNLAAAIMIKKKTTKGRVPPSFLSGGAFSWTLPRESIGTDVTALEASHRNPDDVKIRPLQMPLGVQAEQEKKWGELMVNVQYAVYWKVKALREDTGTVNSRQMRRLVRDRPPQRRALFPGDCKTTWAMKNYVKQEVGDVLKSWRPENLRKKRSQKLIDKITLPQFVDRVRTTTSILRSFRLFKTHDKEEQSKHLDEDDDEGANEECEESGDDNDRGDLGQEKQEVEGADNKMKRDICH